MGGGIDVKILKVMFFYAPEFTSLNRDKINCRGVLELRGVWSSMDMTDLGKWIPKYILLTWHLLWLVCFAAALPGNVAFSRQNTGNWWGALSARFASCFRRSSPICWFSRFSKAWRKFVTLDVPARIDPCLKLPLWISSFRTQLRYPELKLSDAPKEVRE